MSEILGGLAKYAGLWFIAGFITSALTFLIVYLVGGLIGLTTELLLSIAIGSLPFPFNFLAGWYIDPVALVAETSFQIIIFAGLLYLTNR